MARVLYTAEATVTGGRANGHGRTTDGALDVQLRSPKEMGGEGGGTSRAMTGEAGEIESSSGGQTAIPARWVMSSMAAW